MSSIILQQKKELETKKRRKKYWKSLVTALACVVVFCTTYALILPAITMENTAYCGMEEHTHGEECYGMQLHCLETVDKTEKAHEHVESCFETTQELTCEQLETEGHVHSAECEQIETKVICELEEGEEHQHDILCIEETVINGCGLEEQAGHSHEEGCYTSSTKQICEVVSEVVEQAHIHGETCYQKVFDCVKEEHVHSKSCYSNPNADVENREIWENTIPKEFMGIPEEDLIAVAESQLGYKESSRNYVVTENGKTKGYTRYGAWYGSAYGDWCAMFISFCLNYADIDEIIVPREAGCQKWIETLSQEPYQIYRTAEEYVPERGDLIFFNTDAEEDSDHVGIVVEVLDSADGAESTVKTIEGNSSDKVTYRTYALSDATIMGYAMVEAPEEEENSKPVVGVPVEEKTPTAMFAAKTSSSGYAPEGISYTGVWSKDVAAIANSQIGYREENSLSKYDQWAGNDGTNYWNVNFVNYCLSYAGVDKNAIPWNTAYDFSQWRAALEAQGCFQSYEMGTVKPGDLVFVQGWNPGSNYNVGICVEAGGGALYLVFGDMDGNNAVVKEQFWENWTGRLLGYVSLSEQLVKTSDGTLSAVVSYNSGVLPKGAELFVELIEESENHRQLAENYLKPEGSQIKEDYYLSIHFEKDSQRIEPSGNPEILVQFVRPLESKKETAAGSAVQEWNYGVIAANTAEISNEIQAQTDGDGNITEVQCRYYPDIVYAVISTQETNTCLTVQTPYGEAQAVANTSVLSESMQLVIHFVEEPESAWVEKIKETYEKERKIVSKNLLFRVEILDENGNQVQISEDADLRLFLSFKPPLSSALEDGTIARSGEWIVNNVTAEDTQVSLEEVEADREESENVSLSSVGFAGKPNEIYALSAVVTNPAYYETASSYEQLVSVVSSGEEVVQVKLTADIHVPQGSSMIVENGKTIHLDLNGYDITAASTLFTIKDQGEMTLIDSQAAEEVTEAVVQLNLRADEDGDSEAQTLTNKANVGMQASFDKSTEQLTYYVTETEITDPSVGATKETLVKHTVNLKGTIKGSSVPVITVEGGTFRLESGAIINCTNGAIEQSGGILKLSGGYICNNESSSDGGAISAQGDASVILEGTVLAANRSEGDGGSIWIQGKEFLMKEGIVSGNQAELSGGGIFCTGSTHVEISGGYITNNRSDTTEYRGGGGGLFTNGQASIYLDGGYITGNYAESGGGGIRTFAERFAMTGGFINSNYANLSEGGGLSTNEYGIGTILGGYINNNVSNTHQHWGGGGIFSANDSTLYIKRVLVTENDAGGYGGGVAGCSTGRAFIYKEDGGAIYNNTAVARDSEHPHISGGESTKAEDHIYPTTIFRKYGYEDYFCAFNSIISGTMLGGGSANWSGSVDGIPIIMSKEEELSSTYLMGLVSNPSNGDILKAQSEAKVFINGNDSYTHGGGVLGNGYLVIGDSENIKVYSRLKIEASKELMGAELEEGQFEFVIENNNSGYQVALGTNDKDGNITFDHMIPFTEKGTYEYLIYEKNESGDAGKYAGILMDTTEYKVTVVVDQIQEVLESYTEIVHKDRFIITSILVEKRNEGNWEVVQRIEKPDNPDSKPVVLTLTKGSSFHNVVTDYTNFSVVKQWMGDVPQHSVKVQLFRDGRPYGSPVELTAANHWTYHWTEKLPLYYTDPTTGEKKYYTYSMEELDVEDGYHVEYDLFNTTEVKAVWVPYTDSSLILENDYIIVSPDGEEVLYLSNTQGNHLITEQDKISVITQTDPISIDGQEYREYILDGMILPQSIYRAQASDGVRLNNPSAGYRTLAVPSDGSGYNLESSWWPLKDLYAGNARICVGSQEKYMVVYENGKFDAVVYNEWNPNRAKLYTLAYTDPSNETIFKITNSKIEEEDKKYKLDITKVSAENEDVLLSGAEFEIYLADQFGNADDKQQVIVTKTAAGAYQYQQIKEKESVTPTDVSVVITARGGKLVISELPKGTYVLIETKAPNGYLVAEPITIDLESDAEVSTTYRMTIEDKVVYESYELPDTGGAGIMKDRLTGMMLVAAGVLLQIYRKRKTF